MLQMNPYLSFGGQCREAMTFYKDCLGGELTLMTAGDTMGAGCPEAQKNDIMHASLTGNGFTLMATDMMNGPSLVKGNNFSISLNCESEEQIYSLFKELSAGGKEIESVKLQFWGALFGVLIDKFGICWMLNFDKNPQS